MNIILFGPPAAGKGTQADFLCKKYELTKLSTGDVLRLAIADGTALGVKVATIIQQGALVDDTTILHIVEERIRKNTDHKGIIFDGFPRTRAQSVGLETLLEKQGKNLDCAIELQVNREVLLDRLEKRVAQTQEGAKRLDDTRDVLCKRLDVYYEQTMPALEYYEKKKILFRVNGMDSVEEVSRKLQDILDVYVDT